MGVLYARVDGAWVPVIASPPPPADEVWVGPNAPTASETELWVDTDATPVPMLSARIGGNWTTMTSPDEVAVGPDAPTGFEELWYDTDAPGYTPEDLRWQSAWGIIARATIPTSTVNVAAGTPTQIFNTLPNVRLTTGRRYRFRVFSRAIAANPGNGWLRIEGGNLPTMGNDTWVSIGSGGAGYQSLQYELLFDGDGSTVTYRAMANFSVATTFYMDGSSAFYIEDVGPAVPSVPAAVNTAAYGRLNSVTGGTVGSTKNPVTWNAPTGAGFAGRNMTATANGLVVQTAGRYQVNFAASLANCSGGAYMVPQLQVVRAGSSVDSVSVVVGPSGYWLDAHINGQLNAQAGDELRARLDTDIAGCSFDNRTWLEATLIGPL